MRKFSVIAYLPALMIMLFPNTVLAQDTDNTKTKITFERYIRYQDQYRAPYMFDGYEPLKTRDFEEIANDKMLARWKTKQAEKWKNLPTGRFPIQATAYTAAADECGWNTGITASGLKVKEKRTLACPPEFPFGTKVNIEGYGTFRCEDRGGAIKGNKFDIYMVTKAEAFKFGRRNLVAEVAMQ